MELNRWPHCVGLLCLLYTVFLIEAGESTVERRNCAIINIPYILCAPDITKVSLTPLCEYENIPHFTSQETRPRQPHPLCVKSANCLHPNCDSVVQTPLPSKNQDLQNSARMSNPTVLTHPIQKQVTNPKETGDIYQSPNAPITSDSESKPYTSDMSGGTTPQNTGRADYPNSWQYTDLYFPAHNHPQNSLKPSYDLPVPSTNYDSNIGISAKPTANDFPQHYYNTNYEQNAKPCCYESPIQYYDLNLDQTKIQPTYYSQGNKQGSNYKCVEPDLLIPVAIKGEYMPLYIDPKYLDKYCNCYQCHKNNNEYKSYDVSKVSEDYSNNYQTVLKHGNSHSNTENTNCPESAKHNVYHDNVKNNQYHYYTGQQENTKNGDYNGRTEYGGNHENIKNNDSYDETNKGPYLYNTNNSDYNKAKDSSYHENTGSSEYPGSTKEGSYHNSTSNSESHGQAKQGSYHGTVTKSYSSKTSSNDGQPRESNSHTASMYSVQQNGSGDAAGKGLVESTSASKQTDFGGVKASSSSVDQAETGGGNSGSMSKTTVVHKNTQKQTHTISGQPQHMYSKPYESSSDGITTKQTHMENYNEQPAEINAKDLVYTPIKPVSIDETRIIEDSKYSE